MVPRASGFCFFGWSSSRYIRCGSHRPARVSLKQAEVMPSQRHYVVNAMVSSIINMVSIDMLEKRLNFQSRGFPSMHRPPAVRCQGPFQHPCSNLSLAVPLMSVMPAGSRVSMSGACSVPPSGLFILGLPALCGGPPPSSFVLLSRPSPGPFLQFSLPPPSGAIGAFVVSWECPVAKRQCLGSSLT